MSRHVSNHFVFLDALTGKKITQFNLLIYHMTLFYIFVLFLKDHMCFFKKIYVDHRAFRFL